MSQNLIANLTANQSSASSSGLDSLSGDRPTKRAGASAIDSKDPMFLALLAMMQNGGVQQPGLDLGAQNLAGGEFSQLAQGVSAQVGALNQNGSAVKNANPMNPLELPTRVKEGASGKAGGASAKADPSGQTSRLLDQMTATDAMIVSADDSIWNGVEVEGDDFSQPLGNGKRGKDALAAKHALFSGADFVAMKSAARPKLKDDAISAETKLPSIDSLGMNQMLRAEPEFGALNEVSANSFEQATLFGHGAGERIEPAVSGGSMSLEALPTRDGSNEKYALKTENVRQLAQQIGGIKAQGVNTGEIRLRLRPDHLGELRVQVRADGKDVALRFEAKDHRVKAAIESAVADLRDRLQSQNLNLGSVDVQVNREMAAPVASSHQNSDFNAFDMNQQQNAWMNSNGQQSRRDRDAEFDSNDFEQGGWSRSRTSSLSRTQPMLASRLSEGRIDLRA